MSELPSTISTIAGDPRRTFGQTFYPFGNDQCLGASVVDPGGFLLCSDTTLEKKPDLDPTIKKNNNYNE